MSEETRDDGPYENVFLSLGNAKDRSTYTTHVTPRILVQDELDSLYESDGFARRIIDLPAEEMVRAGFEIEGVDDGREGAADEADIGRVRDHCLPLEPDRAAEAGAEERDPRPPLALAAKAAEERAARLDAAMQEPDAT